MVKKRIKIIFLGIIVFVFIISSVFSIKKYLFSGKKSDSLINISYLSEEFVDNYLEEYKEIDTKDKKNILIVTSEENLDETYGAVSVIEAPNNQYILQYTTEEDKKNALLEFNNNESIEGAEENGFYTIDETTYNSWGVEAMSIDYAISVSNIKDLKNVTVAIIDTGCDMAVFNKYYGGKILETYNVLEKSSINMTDENGHGTHIAGTIAESTPSNVRILPIKVSKDGKMYYSDIIAAINYIIYYEKADVINMSFGGYGYNQALEQAIESAKQKNIISVAAAGNDNTNKKHYPSALENTISISSIDSSLKKSNFSNYGSEITFASPGTNIKSIMSSNSSISKENGNADGDKDHETISGTSMATPHAVSAIAMLKSYNKDLTFDNVIDLLKQKAVDLGEEGWDQYFGYGLISFKDVQFCDNTYCDEYGVYKNSEKNTTNIELVDLKLTNCNYYSITNLMASTFRVYYADGTNEELLLSDLPNVKILNYDPNSTIEQNITFNIGDINIETSVTNPSDYESGWEYNILENGNIELTGYESHNLKINKIYIPETIDSKKVVSFADNVKFKDISNDFLMYEYLYLPDNFNKIGDYSLSETGIKHIYGDSTGVEVGNHGLESSSIISVDVPVKKVGEYAFKDCFELLYVNISGELTYVSEDNIKFAKAMIGEYAFYNCKKLTKVEKSNYDKIFVDEIGEYAFYNCISLSLLEIEIQSKIGDYAFYNCFSLINLYLYQTESIGIYSFYGSGIFEADLGLVDVIQKSAFENCKNLKSVSITSGIIEERAFWNSGVETVYIGSLVSYIAEDAFAYAPIKTSDGGNDGEGIYNSIYGLGIVEISTNKLLVGFTNSLGASNTNIPDYITEIGNYAFTGNDNIKKIIIPANVTKIGNHAFEDCYHLSDVYMFGTNIEFGDDTFKRSHEGQIQDSELIIYVHKDSPIKQYIVDKNLNYRHVEPDDIEVISDKTVYKALEKVDSNNTTVKLIYYEKEMREEILSPINYSIVAPISNGVGFIIQYKNFQNFQYGDTYYTIIAKNALGYEISFNIDVRVEKETPEYIVPTTLTATIGQQLSEILLPDGFEWMNPDETIEEIGSVVFKAKYVPDDTVNYKTIENIEIIINVSSKIYTITYNSNDEKELTLTQEFEHNKETKLNENTFIREGYTFKEWNTKEDGTGIRYNNGQTISITENLALYAQWECIKYTVTFDANGGIFTENKSRLVINEWDDSKLSVIENPTREGYVFKGFFTQTVGGTSIESYIAEAGIDQEGLVFYAQWEESWSYEINNYKVDKFNKYIDKIDINTTVDDYKKNIDLNIGYSADVEYKTIYDIKVLYTGSKTKIYNKQNLIAQYTNIIRGDVSGDGAVNSADLLKVRQHLIGTQKAVGVYYLAADITYDDSINSADLLRLRQHLLGTKPIS